MQQSVIWDEGNILDMYEDLGLRRSPDDPNAFICDSLALFYHIRNIFVDAPHLLSKESSQIEFS
jgi:hypothetical protein